MVRGLPGNQQHAFDHLAVVQALADGKNVREISRELNVPYYTLTSFIAALRRKQKRLIRTQCQLVAHYLRNGWID